MTQRIHEADAVRALHSPVVWTLPLGACGISLGWREMDPALRASGRCLSVLPHPASPERRCSIVLLKRCEPMFLRSLDPRVELALYRHEDSKALGSVRPESLAFVKPSTGEAAQLSESDNRLARDEAAKAPGPRVVTLLLNPAIERVHLERFRIGFSSLELVDQLPNLRGPEQTVQLMPYALEGGSSVVSIVHKGSAPVLIEDCEHQALGRVEPGESVLADLGTETQRAALIRCA